MWYLKYGGTLKANQNCILLDDTGSTWWQIPLKVPVKEEEFWRARLPNKFEFSKNLNSKPKVDETKNSKPYSSVNSY